MKIFKIFCLIIATTIFFAACGGDKTLPSPTNITLAIEISEYQPKETFIAAGGSEFIKEIALGRIAVTRQSDGATFSAWISPFREIPKGTPVRLRVVRYDESILIMLGRQFLMVK